MTSSFLLAGRASTAAVLLSVLAVATACSSAPPASAQPGGSGSQGPSAPATSPGQTSPAPTSPVAGTSNPSPPQGPRPCASRDLGARTGNGQGAAGSTYIPIVFTNNSNVTCTLFGYPGVAFAGGSPVSQIGLAATENPATPRRLVTIAPGAVASALLRIVAAQNYPAARCHQVTARYLQVYPPNQTTPIYVSYSSAACSKPIHLLTVDVVKPGSGG
ncbi:MAG TPA: DUF4232 domain-containing protein [Streptosporangiaceae bacterium]